MIDAAPVEIIHAAPGRSTGDDAFGLAYHRGALHVWVIDGATSVSRRSDKMLSGTSDAAWFARSLSDECRRILRRSPLTRGALARALSHLDQRFSARAGPDLDDHDYPVAAMTYLGITPDGPGFRIDSLDFADCFFGLARGPARRIQPADPLPAPLDDVSLSATGPGMERMRARRAAQIRGAGSALTIHPRSAARGRWTRHRAPSGYELLIGSDGYARLWTEYAVASMPQALRSTARTGLARGLSVLRAWERDHIDHGAAPKAADDVTAIRIRLGQPPSRGVMHRTGTGLIWRAGPAGRVDATALGA